MVNIKSFNNIVLDMLQQFRLTQPNLDVKPNSVARDLFVENQAFQIASVYDTIRQIAALQSITNLTGQDLTNYAANFGVARTFGTKATGTVLFTFRSLDADTTIPSGTVIRTRQNITFITVSTITAFTSQINALRATATRFREQLNIANITDEFAIEVSVEAQATGSSGNIAAYSVISHDAAGVNGVTNISSFAGGSDVESDSAFRSRILASFAGANVGTALAYRSTILDLPDSIDALVVEPGDPLMTRDGTIVATDADGNLFVSEPGSGGRVDIYVMGETIQSGTDSFVYNDQSGTQDPTDPDNDVILGQSDLTTDTTLSLNTRRVNTLSGTDDIPNQPIISIVSVSGSASGPNFVEQFTDDDGNLQGNYVLVRDTGDAGGSPFGLDKLRWTSDRISLDGESRTKGALNSIDELSFTDVLEIPSISQDVAVTNENSTVSSSRNFITTKHNPVRTVTRVFNVTTGERYTITDQTPDDTGDINTTGRIQISGRTLPTVSDILQVDYIWIRDFDPNIDFDSLENKDSLNQAQDSVEWGFPNYIRDERKTVSLDAYDNLTFTTDLPISRLLSVNTFEEETVSVSIQAVTQAKIIQVSKTVLNVAQIKDTSKTGSPEVFNTNADDGNFANLIITLPTDTLAEAGDTVVVTYNLNDLLDVEGYDSGLVLNREVTLLPSDIVPNGTTISANYVTSLSNILPATDIGSLPISTDGLNSFTGVDGYQPVINEFSGSTIVSNKRRSPSALRVSVSGIPTRGTLKVVGTTINKYTGTYAATAGNISLAVLIRRAEGLPLNAPIPSNISVARVTKIEKVEVNSIGTITGVDYTYDLTNYTIWSNNWDKANARSNSSLPKADVVVAPTDENNANEVTTGTNLRVTFYYEKVSDAETLFYSRNGTMITDKIFGHISSINRISGFQDAGGTVGGQLTIDTFTQPTASSAYFVDYDYTAPKENERITVNTEFNQLIVDATTAIEETRPITSDVLVKQATKIELDVEASIIISNAFRTREATVQQDVADNITATLSATALGTTLDTSDIIDNAYSVEGLDRIRITRFNISDVSGTKISISAEKSEFLAPGTVTVTVEER